MIKKLFYTLFVLLLLSCMAVGGALYWYVVAEPGDEISQENIRRILARESPVFYSDGISPLGVFFADAHRQYVEYGTVPSSFINALVAAEDNRFFSHFGFDIIGIGRAAIKNFEARRVVQGGSTLTQQAAKNLFKRQDRSVQAKLKELLYALRLEYRYTKEQILEFYVNQFYVSGNGHGLGVAARYYFDKEPQELSLVESAYIAGSVKRPNFYNPFIKKTKEAADRAREEGRLRTRYVLKKMRELAMISEQEYQQAVVTPIDFRQGAVGYALDYVMEMVTDAVASERVVAALAEHDIDNISTSGIKVITTVDKQIQSRTLYALRKQLSLLDVRLRGYERQEVQEELAKTDYSGDRQLDERAFLFGVIRSIRQLDDQVRIEVYFGRRDGSGIIDRDGIAAMVDARVKWQEHRWSEPAKKDFQELLNQLKEGDRVWVSVREMVPEGLPLLDLERFPKVKGGAIVMQQGRLAAVAGGVENRHFNRAVYGKRTMGSSFKPFLYTAALQLGWNAADLLENKRDVFVYQNQAYFPRPDHAIENEKVSMSWAGVGSENLASVWLATHLCDFLGRTRLEETAAHLGLTPKVVDGQQEPYRLFRTRLRDRYGIVINQDVVRQAAFRKTVLHIKPDLIFEGLDSEYEAVRNMHYGLGFRKYREQIDNDPGGGGDERQLRRAILSRNFLAYGRLERQLRQYFEAVDDPWSRLELKGAEAGDAELFFDRATGRYIYGYPASAPEQAERIDRWRMQTLLAGFSTEERRSFIDAVRLGGAISVAAYELIEKQVEQEYQQMSKLLPYSMDVLEHVEDYRILVGLHYLLAFGKALGVESPLAPVLSFPLGSNVVTLLETTRVYEGLITGTASFFREKNGEVNNTLTVIDRIESEDGKLLYRPEPEFHQVVSPRTSLEVGHILENTVKFGTGRLADQQVKLKSAADAKSTLDDLGLSVPLLGKTGTANNYTNASFFGYLPALNSEGNGMVIEGGYAVGVYVGFDDNQEMRRKSTRITGSAGALPAWVDIVQALLLEKGYASGIDPIDLSFYGLSLKRNELGQVNIGVNQQGGGQVRIPLAIVDPLDRYQPSIMTFGSLEDGNSFKAKRVYAPFWQQQVPQDQLGGGIIEQDL